MMNRYNVSLITPDFFFSDNSMESKKKLFKKLVQRIEIELHSYCNRTCHFCPNSFIDRKTKTYYLNEDTFLKTLNELATIDYDGELAFTRYSEPLSNEIVYERFKQAKSILPNSKLHINTNADYLNNDTLKKAYDSGLDSLFIQIYLPKNVTFTFSNVEKYASKIIDKVSDIDINLGTVSEHKIDYNCSYRNMNVLMYSKNFEEIGTNRSGLNVNKHKYLRETICKYPFTDFVIDYNGLVVPCCNFRSDNINHKQYILGNVNEDSIFNIYFNEASIKFKNSIISENLPKICKECNFGLISYNRKYIKDLNLINKTIEKVKNEPKLVEFLNYIFDKRIYLDKVIKEKSLLSDKRNEQEKEIENLLSENKEYKSKISSQEQEIANLLSENKEYKSKISKMLNQNKYLNKVLTNYNSLFRDLTSTNLLTKPVGKYKAYKKLLNYYNKGKK